MRSIVRGAVALPALVVLLWLLAAFSCTPTQAHNLATQYSQSHFTLYGVKLPSQPFASALQSAAVDISHLSCRKSLVILGMANEEALEHTVPHFLDSLRRVRLSSGKQAGQSLDGKVVLVAWSMEALSSCCALQTRFDHQCVRDEEHVATQGSFGFHDASFNSLGFAKIKYILNGLSAGHDVVFLDTDIVVLADPLPYFLGGGKVAPTAAAATAVDMYGSMEKCMVYNVSQPVNSPQLSALGRRAPPINIGVLYFKATAAVTRCVYSWIWEMHTEVLARPKVWDQDVYGKVMMKCAEAHGLQWRVLDPRLFQSGCFPGCGCTYSDDEVNDLQIGRFSRGYRKLAGGLCVPKHWKDWLMRHFPCSGLTADKGQLMQALVEGFYESKPAAITRKV